MFIIFLLELFPLYIPWFFREIFEVLIGKYNVLKTYDFGCGPGQYVKKFNENGFDATGYDGNPITSNILNCKIQDLTDKKFQLSSVNFLLCLEVCEHVPEEYEDDLLDTINRHVSSGGLLILSWAVVGQDGTGHVNCQNNDYVIAKFRSLGFSLNEADTAFLRKNVSNAIWFKNTFFCIEII